MRSKDYRGFAPRVGLAWDPTGSGKWTVRSAYSIFYDPFYNGQGGPLQDIISAPPWFKILQISSPDYANPTAGLDPLTPGFNYPLLFDAIDPHMRLPYAQDWNFTVQRFLGNNWLAEVAYVGTKGTKLPRFVEVNPAIYIPGTCGGQPCSSEETRISAGLTPAARWMSPSLIVSIRRRRISRVSSTRHITDFKPVYRNGQATAYRSWLRTYIPRPSMTIRRST